ncbi:2-C-methyl-D-erythritol 4-phosphate cytidylyltransferase [Microbacterium lacus]|uniref:2-C-methyl-D-erythritol 4-phosphate cytidylyltransferase n=1 Tax=Microbacterium lacus TaxID=415217 RepID=UPI00384E4FCD
MYIAPSPRVAVIVVAAGSGTRLRARAPKAFVAVGAESMLCHALHGIAAVSSENPLQTVIVVPPGYEDAALDDARAALPSSEDLVSVTPGGATRQESVAAGLARIAPQVEIVLVHDAARALTPPEVYARVIAAVKGGAAGVVPVVPVVDTIKRVEAGRVVAAVDRSVLSAAQTPQGFDRAVLDAAYAEASDDFTDDAALVAAAGHDVVAVEGDPMAFKITTPADLDRAHALVAPRERVSPPTSRVGIGTDVHAFGGEGSLWLAGLEWPGEQALSGHSDGDAIAHAIVDALLAAAGLGDIGTHFGTDHPEYAGAHAGVFLERTREILAEAGWRVGNVSVQVQANRPRFAARRTEAEAVLSAAVGAPVSLSATTTDGLGFAGAGEGVAAFAIAMVYLG